MREHAATNPHGINHAGGQENHVFSPNLARYLKPETARQGTSSASHEENNHPRQPQHAGHGAKKKKKTALARKNLVVMCPAKHLSSLDNSANDSFNMTQLLFSPTDDKEEVLHSIFSPVGSRTQQKGRQRQMSKKTTTPENASANTVDYNCATNPSGDNHGTSHRTHDDDIHVVKNKIVFQTEAEKENIPPAQDADDLQHSHQFSSSIYEEIEPKNDTKASAKIPIDDDTASSSSSLHEFYTPKSHPKTPGTKASREPATNKIMESISYDSFNTHTLSREHLLGSCAKDECTLEEEKKEEGMPSGQRFERLGNEICEDDESAMVFATPKQRESGRNTWNESNANSDDNDDEEFFSPLAHFPPPSNDFLPSSYDDPTFNRLSMTTNDNNVASHDPMLENGSSYYLMNEVKNILAASKCNSHIDSSLHVIQDDAIIDNGVMDECEFFRPLVQHPPLSSECGSLLALSHESSLNGLSPIPTQNINATMLGECPWFEDGSSYNLINNVKSILADSKSDAPRTTAAPLPFACLDDDKLATEGFSEEVNLSHPDIQPASVSNNENTPNSQQTQINTHIPTALSSLPASALTVDFVKNCDSTVTLEKILSVLSSTKRGKQLRQPSLVRLVQKRLEKVNQQKNSVGGGNARDSLEGNEMNVDNDDLHHELQWNHSQRGTEWKVTLPPRIAGGRKGSKNIVWSEEARDDTIVSVNSNSVQGSSFGSSGQDAQDDKEATSTVIYDPFMMTPDAMQVVSLPAVSSSSPSIQLSSIAESSLDMNLSESFNLGDESAYWKQIEEYTNIEKEQSIQEKVVDEAAPKTQSRLEVDLKQQLEEVQKAYQQAKSDVKRLTSLLEKNKQNKEASALDSPSAVELRKETEATRLANRALANALAISEKDLAEALELRDKKAIECKHLLSKLNEASDQNSFLSSKIKKLEKELHSCNAYIDSLYAELQEKSPLNDLQAELEQREMEWLALENRYNEAIEQLQAEVNAQSKGVSMDMYLSLMAAARQHKLDAAEKQHKIDELSTMVGSLRDQIENMHRSSSKSGLKSVSALCSKVRLRQVSPTYHQNDENTQPNQHPRQEAQLVGKHNSMSIGGTGPGYIADVETSLEGRKGLSNQLRRARRFTADPLKVRTHNI